MCGLVDFIIFHQKVVNIMLYPMSLMEGHRPASSSHVFHRLHSPRNDERQKALEAIQQDLFGGQICDRQDMARGDARGTMVNQYGAGYAMMCYDEMESYFLGIWG